MGKLLKYELKGSYKVIGIILSIIIIVNLFMYFSIGKLDDEVTVAIVLLTLFGVNLANVIYIISLLRRDLYEDTGYLTFTLPLTGNQIIGAKLISGIIWIMVIGCISMIFFMINIKNIFGTFIANEYVIKIFDISFILTSFLTLILFLFTVYFSIAISKVTFKNKKIGGLWFIIFIGLNILICYIQYKIIKIFPYYLRFSDLSIVTPQSFALNNLDLGGMLIIEQDSYLNIANVIYELLLVVGLFFGTGYLVENKINI